LRRYREYDKTDFEAAELLQLWPDQVLMIDRSVTDMAVQRKEIKDGIDFARGLYDLPIFVPGRVRTILEQARFHDLRFESFTLLRNAQGDDDSDGELEWDIVGEPWWFLNSEVRLPPLSRYLERVGPRGKVLPREARGGIREPGFDDVELHYYRSEFKEVGEFDVARDWESGSRAARIIVSKRFYEFCKQNGLKCSFKPARIDEG